MLTSGLIVMGRVGLCLFGRRIARERFAGPDVTADAGKPF
jgi:hypothetical protein